ncbi:WEB family protein At1g75720 [Cucumis sativus]|nr:WEB family protein At1g75720 [Cucumis sativus]
MIFVLTLKQQPSFSLSPPLILKLKQRAQFSHQTNRQIHPRTHPKLTNSPTMEDPEIPSQTSASAVDTSRPFRSVKEAVAVFGERLLVGDAYSSSPKPSTDAPLPEIGTWEAMPSSTTTIKEEKEHVLVSLKKLEAELEETKEELRLLKEREEDTEVALASLNAELHKNMSKLAEAEAAAAGKAAAARRIVTSGRIEEEMKRSELKMRRMEETDSPTLAQILSFGDKIGYFGGKKEKKKIKKKPIIPLVGDLLLILRKKGSSENDLRSSFN